MRRLTIDGESAAENTHPTATPRFDPPQIAHPLATRGFDGPLIVRNVRECEMREASVD
jgi:hypothetical protein